jgi:hypothetical protein
MRSNNEMTDAYIQFHWRPAASWRSLFSFFRIKKTKRAFRGRTVRLLDGLEGRRPHPTARACPHCSRWRLRLNASVLPLAQACSCRRVASRTATERVKTSSVPDELRDAQRPRWQHSMRFLDTVVDLGPLPPKKRPVLLRRHLATKHRRRGSSASSDHFQTRSKICDRRENNRIRRSLQR